MRCQGTWGLPRPIGSRIKHAGNERTAWRARRPPSATVQRPMSGAVKAKSPVAISTANGRFTWRSLGRTSTGTRAIAALGDRYFRVVLQHRRASGDRMSTTARSSGLGSRLLARRATAAEAPHGQQCQPDLFPARFLPCRPAPFYGRRDTEIFKLFACLQRRCKPSRLQPASRPRFLWIVRIAIFRRHRTPQTASNSIAVRSTRSEAI
jgi:hypothetical protein